MSDSQNTEIDYNDSRGALILSQIRALRKKTFASKDRNRLIITQVVNGLLGLVSGKLIAIYITPGEFGKFNIQFATFTFFSGVFLSPLLQFKKTAYQEYFSKYGYSNYFRSFTLNAILLALSVLLFFSFYNKGEFLSTWFVTIILLYIPLYYLNGFVADQFNILGKLKLFSFQSMVNNIFGTAFITTMYIYFNPARNGALILWLMQVMSLILGLLLFARKIVRYKPIKKEKFIVFWKKQITFTLPLILLAFFTWINNYFDRYIIESNLGLNDVGIYNVNYGLGSKFFLILNPVFLVLLTPHIFRSNTIAFKKKMIAKYVKAYFGLGLILVLLIFITHQLIGELLLSIQYKEGFYLIYWTSLCMLIITGTNLFEILFYVEHRTKTILLSNILAAVISILLNLILVPVFGMTGAIFAALFASTVKLIYTYLAYNRI